VTVESMFSERELKKASERYKRRA